jgi:hypothetical protein
MNGNIVQLFTNSRSILIVVSKSAKIDSLAAALGLYLALIAQGKSVHIATEATVNGADKLIGFDKIKKTIEQGGNILKVTFPYSDGNIDKVTYNITDDRFNLLIEPRAGAQPLTNKDVQFGYTGGQTDLIVTIDAPTLEALGDLYLDNPDVFTREKIVNIDRRFDNQQYGGENLVEKEFSSTSEIVMRTLSSLHWELNNDIATNLYAGLMSATNNFTSFSTNAQSFEAASILLKSGARKLPIATPQSRPAFGANPAFPAGAEAMPKNQSIFAQPPQVQPQFQPQSQPQPQPESQPQPQPQAKKPPQDWLKPKIFKSTDLI